MQTEVVTTIKIGNKISFPIRQSDKSIDPVSKGLLLNLIVDKINIIKNDKGQMICLTCQQDSVNKSDAICLFLEVGLTT